mgnify:CR=1 FL=1
MLGKKIELYVGSMTEGDSLSAKASRLYGARRLFWIISARILCRILWQTAPSLFTCSLFWATIWLPRIGPKPKEEPSNLEIVPVIPGLLGLLSNTIVTLVNGGFMPVLGDETETFSIWVSSAQLSNPTLLLLGDIFDVGIGLASIGDVLIFAGLIGTLAIDFEKRINKWRRNT